MFYGSIVALITPFKNGQVDFDSIKKLVEWHISEGTEGIVPCGSTGESYLLTPEEYQQVIETCVKTASKRVPIIAGTGCISTADTIKRTKQAEKAGADAALIVTSAYIKPSQNGLFDHYKTVSESTSLPIILYDMPGRTHVKLEDETIYKLAKLKNVVGFKDGTSILDRPIGNRINLDDDFTLLSGEDLTAVAYLAGGGNGVISVTANVAPKLCSQLQKAWKDQNLTLVNQITQKLHQLNKSMFIESNPCPVKYAVSKLGKCHNELRSPLSPISKESEMIVDKAMQVAGII